MENIVETVRRTQHICDANINLKRFSVKQCLIYFRLWRSEIPRIATLSGWTGRTVRNRYICYPITEKFLILFCRACPDVENLGRGFGMHSSKLSEVFWEVIKSLYSTHGHFVTLFQKYLFEESEHQYAESPVHSLRACARITPHA